MFSFNPQVDSPEIVLEKHISVKAAAEFSGYSIQYLRRLLRNGRLEGIKIGQVWLIEMASFDRYLRNGQMLRDRRRGPRKPKAIGGWEVSP
jgi:excisionase family DNA binding protein